MEYLLIEKKAWLEMQTEAKRLNERMKKTEQYFFPAGDSGWIDNAAVCLWLNISKRTLQYYRNSGILPYTTIRNKCYYKPEDVKAVFDRNTTKQK